jgi:long-chain acyl-CoA synthetase
MAVSESTPTDATPLDRLLDPHDAASTALVFEGRSWTYADLAATAAALSTAMADLAGERVAFMLPNGLEAVTTYLACFRAGAVATPLNMRYAAPEVERALRRVRPRWLVVHESRLDRLEHVDAAVLDGVRVLTVGTGATPPGDRREPFAPLLQSPARAASPPPAPEQPALLFLTSGSTGTPKGVVHSRRSVSAMLTSTGEAMGDVGADDVMQVSDPLVHVSGFIETMTTLLRGGTVLLYDGFDLETYVAGLLEHRPTLLCTHVDVLAQLARDPRAGRGWMASLRGVYTGGDTVPAALQREFADVLGSPIGVGYGMTEAIWLSVNREPRLDRDACVGRPVGGTEIRTDADTGELLVRGPMVMSHYWEDDPLTGETLRDGWFHTGDLGRCDEDGVWWFEGRIKDLIVRRTSKITPGEVESAVNQHPDVLGSAVVAAPDAVEGQVPVAFVVLRAGAGLDADDLVAFLRQQIAEYKLPSRVHFLDALPLTPSGKISHRDLHETV